MVRPYGNRMSDTKPAIYLDYNATAPLRLEAAARMTEFLTQTGNPSSVHSFGRNVRKQVEQAREQLAQLIHADPADIVFTSGATEANNAVLAGAPVKRVFYSGVEHPSVLEVAKQMPHSAVIPVDANGVVKLDELEKMLQASPEKTLVSVMWVNNETGVIQPVAAVAEIAAKHGALFHCDAVQALGKIDIDLRALRIDYLTLSAHKIGGPSGIGALVYAHDTELEKFLVGGGQEKRRRAGTENTLGMIGFGAAAAQAAREEALNTKLAAWRDALQLRMKNAVPQVEFVGADAPRVGNTIQMILPGVTAEKQLMALDLAGIAVSSGSACSSGSIRPSAVLLAMGIPEARAMCAIRLSIGFATTEAELERFFEVWVTISQRLLKS